MFHLARMRVRTGWSAALCTLLLLCGCAGQPRNSGPVLPHIYSESVDIGGRLSAQFVRDDKPESWTGSFSWDQSPQAIKISLQSPFGQTLATIDVTDTGATLTQPDHAPRRAPNVDALALQALGWPLPVSNLRNWLQAYVIAKDGTRMLATPQSTAPIATQDDWRISYVSWQDDQDSGMQNVPKRIDMERDTAEVGKLQMRLVITSWQTR